jgi:four helix bundle protein
MSTIHSFRDLEAWKESHHLVLEVYKVTKKFPKEELFSLVNQLRRAAVSITSNIAEGFARNSYKEKVQFYAVAKGSLTEVESQLLVSRDLGYIRPAEAALLEEHVSKVGRIMTGLIRKSKSFS